MPNIKNITFTGPDALTDTSDLIKLSNEASKDGLHLEWGLLFSPSRAGQPGRYDKASGILSKLQALQDYNLAIHFCGDSVKQLLNFEDSEASILLEAAALHGKCRLQLNFNQKRADFKPAHLVYFLRENPKIEIILQANANNQSLLEELSKLKTNPNNLELLSRVSVLFDASGGNGITPAGWPSIDQAFGFKAGYAGGLSPSNIKEQSEKIWQASNGAADWLDMENSLRVEDVFSVERCKKVIEKILSKNIQKL